MNGAFGRQVQARIWAAEDLCPEPRLGPDTQKAGPWAGLLRKRRLRVIARIVLWRDCGEWHCVAVSRRSDR